MTRIIYGGYFEPDVKLKLILIDEYAKMGAAVEAAVVTGWLLLILCFKE